MRARARALWQQRRGPARSPAALVWLGPAPGPGSNPCSEHHVFLLRLGRATHASEVKQKPSLTSTRKLQLLKCHLEMSCLPFFPLHAHHCFIQNWNAESLLLVSNLPESPVGIQALQLRPELVAFTLKVLAGCYKSIGCAPAQTWHPAAALPHAVTVRSGAGAGAVFSPSQRESETNYRNLEPCFS